MSETLDSRYFGVIPDDLVLMRRLAAVLAEEYPSRNKIVREANSLVEYYAQRWEMRIDIRHFFETGGLRQRIERELLKRQLFEEFAPKHELYSLVLMIFHEFEIYVSQYEKTRTFIKKQRSLASRKKRYFFA